MAMNYNEFKDYLEHNGVTKARITQGMYGVPKGTILFFGKGVTTLNYKMKGENKHFGYEFIYDYQSSWKDSYKGEFELIDEKKQNSPSKNTTMTTKTIYQVLVVNKKTGVAEKEKTLSADNEQQAILKTFGVDAENTFIKVTEVGSYEEDKPLKAIIEKPTK